MTETAPEGFLRIFGRVFRQKDEKSTVAMLSVASNSTLVAFKLAIGIVIGSVSVVSEAIHSGVDLVAAVIALFAVRAAGKPADEGHAFGHGKFENLSGAIEAILILVAAAGIVHEALHKLVQPGDIDLAGWGVLIMLVSCVVNAGVSRMLFMVGRRTDSVALLADAWHLRTDVWTSAGVMAGLLIYEAGRRLFPSVDLKWVDPAAALAVATLIVKAAYDLTVQSVRDLLDQSLPEAEVRVIRERVREALPAAPLRREEGGRASGDLAPLRQAPSGERRPAGASGDLAPLRQARSFRCLRTRKAGAVRFVEMELVMNPGMSVQESHAVADRVTARIKDAYPGAEVTIHIEPCADDCTDECRDACVSPVNPGKGR